MDNRTVYTGIELVSMGKADQLNETFLNSNGEVFTTINDRLCYISKAAREHYNNFEVSKLQVVEIETEEGTLLRMQLAGAKPAVKKGNWH